MDGPNFKIKRFFRWLISVAPIARKWKTPASQSCKEKEQSKLNTADNIQARTIKGIFMFGTAARTVTETKRSLPTMQELSSRQEPVGNHVKITKNPGRWSRFGKFRVKIKKTQGPNHMGHTTKKRMNTATTPRKINPYELRDQELRIEEGKRAKRTFFNWKRRQQQKLKKNTEVLDVSELLRKKVLKEPMNKKR